VDADDFPDAAAGFGAGVDGGAYRGDVAAQRDRHQPAADLVLLDERHVGGLESRVARFDRRDDAFGFDQSDCFTVCRRYLSD